MIIGYARVSTEGQTLEAQVEALQEAGAEKVFQEKASGTKADRLGLGRAIAALNAGDVLLVTRLDRLARSTRDLLNTLDAIVQRGASFRSLADAWADTTTPQGKLVLTVIGGFAEFERSLIAARTTEGRARAKAKGRHIGRPQKLSAHQEADALAALRSGSVSQRDLARRYGVSEATISRFVAKHGSDNVL